MKKEMKHALVALGLSTLLVPTFANQVVSAQEESHETITSVSPEEVRKEVNKIKESYKELQDKNKQKILNEIEKVDWKTIPFSQDDINEIKNKIPEILSNRTQWFFESLKRQEEEILNSSFYLEYWKERLYSINPSSRDELYEIESIKREISEEILRIATLKKKDHIISYIKKNPYYTNIEREKMLKQASSVYVSYGGTGPGTPGWISTYYDKMGDLNEYLKKIASLLSDDFQAFSLAPIEKNIREVNAVAFMEKTAISNDDSLSKADKVSMFSKIDDIVEEAVRKIKTEADISEDGNYKNSRMLSPEELSVFTKRIEDVYQGKAKPKVTKEEAIQAVSTGNSSSVSALTSTQATVTSNGETKKDYQASKWFKESGKWYYNDFSGNLVRNRWVGRYYLKADASMAASEWIYDEDYKSWFYVDSTGSYVEKAWQGEYYLKRGGYMAKSEWVFDSQYDSWYYLNQDGKYARNQWIKDGDKWYYLLADGKLAKNMTINGYKVNEKGEWV